MGGWVLWKEKGSKLFLIYAFSSTYSSVKEQGVIDTLTQQLEAGIELTPEQAASAVDELVREDLSPEPKAAFLTALARKGETVGEIAAFARVLREKSVRPPLASAGEASEILDVCGTGGDRLNTFNISTTVAIIAAAAGVMVAKHGNRAITSQCGSADVLEALGIRTDLTPAETAEWLRKHHFAFFFAPRFHPAFKGIGPARKLCAERGQRTIFNFLGPLLNPARPTCQLVGVPAGHLCEPLAKVLQSLGLRRGMVVSGQAGEGCLDELSTLGENTIAEFYQERGFSLTSARFEHLCSHTATLADLVGGDRQASARIVRNILGGRERGAKREAVLLNAGAALFVAGKGRTISDGFELAGGIIDSGLALAKLEELVEASKTA